MLRRKPLDELLTEICLDAKSSQITKVGEQLRANSIKDMGISPDRVFNSFDINQILDANLSEKLYKEFFALLPDEKNIEKDENLGIYIVKREENKKLLFAWLQQINDLACEDLLDGYGSIKTQIIKILDWKEEAIKDPALIIRSFVECVVRETLKRLAFSQLDFVLESRYYALTTLINKDFKVVLQKQTEEIIRKQIIKRDTEKRSALSELIFRQTTTHEDTVIHGLLQQSMKPLDSILETAYEACCDAKIQSGSLAQTITSIIKVRTPNKLLREFSIQSTDSSDSLSDSSRTSPVSLSEEYKDDSSSRSSPVSQSEEDKENKQDTISSTVKIAKSPSFFDRFVLAMTTVPVSKRTSRFS